MRHSFRLLFITALIFVSASVQAYQFDDFDTFDEEMPEASSSKDKGVKESRQLSSSDFRALSEAKNNKSEEALVQAASRILSQDPDNLIALNALAVFYFEKKKYGLSKIILNRAMSKHPNHPALHNNMAIVYLAEGEPRKAIAAFTKALEIKSDYKVAAANLGSIYIEYKDYSRALAPLEAGYKIVKGQVSSGDVDAVGVANNYALALAGTGQLSEAEDIFEDIADGKSRNMDVMINYAILLVDLKKDAKAARSVISKVKFIADDPKVIRQIEEIEDRAEALEK